MLMICYLFNSKINFYTNQAKYMIIALSSLAYCATICKKLLSYCE